eukprot:Em0018g601a
MDLLAVFAIMLFVSRVVKSWDLAAETNDNSSAREHDVLHKRLILKGETNANGLRYDALSAKNQVDRELAGSIQRRECKNGAHKLPENHNHGMSSGHRGFTRRVGDGTARMSKYVRKLTCDRPHFPVHGAISSSHGRGGHFHVGSKIQYRCEPGYVLRGAHWNKCVHYNGTPNWYLPTPTCQRAKHCDLSAPKNGYVRASCIYPGCIAVYSCKRGYKMSGRYITTCLPEGKWSSSEFRCN